MALQMMRTKRNARWNQKLQELFQVLQLQTTRFQAKIRTSSLYSPLTVSQFEKGIAALISVFISFALFCF